MSGEIAASVRRMWDDDAASRKLGMELHSAADGDARLTMTVTSDMVNGHGMCHGGYLFMLADSAFACACNSPRSGHGRCRRGRRVRDVGPGRTRRSRRSRPSAPATAAAASTT